MKKMQHGLLTDPSATLADVSQVHLSISWYEKTYPAQCLSRRPARLSVPHSNAPGTLDG